MKTILLSVVTMFFFSITFAQTITWSPDLVKPKETEINSLLTFPGTDENNYYVDESVFGTETIKRKWKDFIQTVDKATLKVIKETDLSGEVAEDGKKYFNVSNFINQNNSYNFFIDMNDKEIYTVYATVKKIGDPKTPALKAIQKVDITSEKIFKNGASIIKHKDSKESAALKAAYKVDIKPAYDGKSIISAFIYQTLDDDYSMLNISEWNEDLNATVSNNYKIPFKAYAKKDKRVFGSASNAVGINPSVGNFTKDNNGFVYVIINSAIPENDEAGMIPWVYQFKLSDPAYVKTYHNEIAKKKKPEALNMFQNQSGKIFIAATSIESSDEDSYHINSAYIASFGATGQLQPVFAKKLSPDMLYNFSTKEYVDKNDGVSGLTVINILPATDGGCFVLWEEQYTNSIESEANDGVTAQRRSETYFGNYTILIQYYNSANKMLWQKPVYKKQSRNALLPDIYSKVATFMFDNAVYLFYPDDPQNANKAIDDKEVSSYDIRKFASKDLAGMVAARIDTKGIYTRKYINWPQEKIGFALCTNSFKPTGNGEWIGAARKINRAGLFIKSQEYTFFKLKF